MHSLCWAGDGHPLLDFAIARSQWPTIKRFVVCVIKLQAAFPELVLRDSLHHDVNSNVLRDRLSIVSLNVPHVKIAPEMIRLRNRDGDEIAAIDGDGGTFLGVS